MFYLHAYARSMLIRAYMGSPCVHRITEAQPLTARDVMDWERVQACFKEALRIFPPGSPAIRECAETTTIQGYRIRKRTSVHLSIYNAHHSPDTWDSPEEFRPERFLKPLSGAEQAAYMPFGLGPRNCIGCASKVSRSLQVGMKAL
jgi:cytochrome P450